ncbi:MAG: hypothetical protein HYS62_02020 [Candidatus Aenigmarchaeota archaeon]|nr:hypothetical protein [Candidatus Aenigmarchaeota archaeon]
MDILEALLKSLSKNKKWIIVGAIIYLIPVIYRLTTENSFVPFLDNTLFLYQRSSQIIPVNLETLGALFLIPSAIGAIIGVSFLENLFSRRFSGLEKYVGRVFGSLFFAVGWTAMQFSGFVFFNPVGPWGNLLWSGPDVYARNLLVALTVGPLVPYAIEFIYKIKK